MSESFKDTDDKAKELYELYCQEVGGKAFNGDPLPKWKEFAADSNKQVQVKAWRRVAIRVLFNR